MHLRGRRIGQYRILNLIRKGGMGEVYLAEDTSLARYVAIKIIWTDTSYYEDSEKAQEAIRLFKREAQVLAKFNHQHILPIHELKEDDIDGMPFMYLVMPYYAEGSLTDWLHSNRDKMSLSIWDIEHIVNQAASALQKAHDQNIIHLDVKASNFLILGAAKHPSQLQLQLADFGIAKLMTSTSKSQNSRGTPLYMAPEQWSRDPVPATDQYALAAMTYELLTGHPPFLGNTKEQLWRQHRSAQPVSPSTYNPHIPKALDDVILRALEKRPESRFPSVTDFAQAFRQALLSDRRLSRTHGRVATPISLSTISTVERTVPVAHSLERQPSNLPPPYIPPEPQHHWGKVLFISCCVLVLLAGSSWLFYLSQKNDTSLTSDSISPAMTHTAITKTNSQTASVNLTNTVNAANSTGTAQSNNANATSTANTYAIATANAYATQIAQANATSTQTAANNATGTAYATTIIGTGKVLLNDPLLDNSQNHGWATTSYHDDNSGCVFTGGTYHAIVNTSGSFTFCFAKNTNFGNFSCEISMKIMQGNQGGIVFRANEGNGTYYYFHISSTGLFALDVYNSDIYQRTLQNGFSSAILTGSGQTNVIGIVAIGSSFTFLVNKQALITNAQDTQFDPGTYSQGEIGVVAQTTGNFTNVSFSNLVVWQR